MKTMMLGAATVLLAMSGGSVLGCAGGDDGGSTAGTDGSTSSVTSAGATSGTGTISSSGGTTAPPLVIENVTIAGNGCPDPGAVHVTVKPDTGAILITYPPLSLSYPPGASFQHESCTVGLTLHAVPGRRIVVNGSSVHGKASLPAGASGKEDTSVFWAGDPATNDMTRTLTGPLFGPYGGTDPGTGTAVRSPCGRGSILNITVGLSLQVPQGSQQSASLDVGKVEIPLEWEGC